MKLTLWNDDADVEFQGNEVILLKNVKVSSYQNQLGLDKSYQTTMLIDPDIPEAKALRDWHHQFLINLRSPAPTEPTANQPVGYSSA